MANRRHGVEEYREDSYRLERRRPVSSSTLSDLFRPCRYLCVIVGSTSALILPETFPKPLASASATNPMKKMERYGQTETASAFALVVLVICAPQ